MPYAYKTIPEYQTHFDTLNTRGTRRVDVECPRGCGVHYTLVIKTDDADPETLERYRRMLQEYIGACNDHPGLIGL